jgi:hypothetical protein
MATPWSKIHNENILRGIFGDFVVVILVQNSDVFFLFFLKFLLLKSLYLFSYLVREGFLVRM